MNIPEVATTAAIYALSELNEMQEYITEDLQRFATAAIEAALPHIEATLRKQIAADIRDEMNRPERIEMADRYEGYFQGQRSGLETAARIAEEGTTK